MSDSALLTVPGERWACHACGACCRLYELGPVEPAVIADLDAAGIDRAWGPAADGWYETRTSGDGRVAHFLQHRDGHCVFLQADNRCAVHAAFGEAAKPGFCREYPFHVAEREDGLAVVVRPSCASHHRSRLDGAPVDAAAVVALPRAASIRKATTETLPLWPGVAAPAASVAALEPSLGRARPESGATRLTAQRAVLVAATGKAGPLPDPERARLATGAVVEGVRRMMVHAAGDGDADPHRRSWAAESESVLAAALPRLGRPVEGTAERDAWLDSLAPTFLLARWYLGLGGLAQGLAFLHVQEQLARTAADRASAAALVVRWTKLTENQAVLALLRRAEPAFLDIFWHG